MSSTLLVNDEEHRDHETEEEVHRNVKSGGKVVSAAIGVAQECADQECQQRRHADGDPEIAAIAQLADESAPHQRVKLRPFVVPANLCPLLLLRRCRQSRDRFAFERNLLHVLDQAKRFVFVAPEFRRVTARGNELSAIVLLVDNVAADIAQRRLEDVEDELRPRRPAGRTRAEVGAELMLMLGFREVAQHVVRRAEENQAPAFVEEDRLVKHLEKLRARLMDRDDDDLVMRHPADDLDHVLRVLRGKTGGRLVEEVNVGAADHIEPDVEPFPLAAAERLFHRAADDAVAPFVQSKLDQFALQPARPIARGKVRGAHRGGKLQILADGQIFVERILLRDVTDVAFEVVEVFVERVIVQQNLSASRLNLAAENLEQSALARPARPHHANQLAAIDRERNAIERDLRVAEAMIEIHDLEAANDVPLFLDDALGEIAAQELPDIDPNGVAIRQRRRARGPAHRGP